MSLKASTKTALVLGVYCVIGLVVIVVAGALLFDIFTASAPEETPDPAAIAATARLDSVRAELEAVTPGDLVKLQILPDEALWCRIWVVQRKSDTGSISYITAILVSNSAIYKTIDPSDSRSLAEVGRIVRYGENPATWTAIVHDEFVPKR